jgi:hypothetical protein
VLFVETPPSSLSFIYRSLGAFHSLQPAPDDDGYSVPSVPALKPRGFVTWQTIQLLLGPEEHVPFLQKAVTVFEVKDPETGVVFPRVLPKECFPERPDEAMESWYEGVAERLKREAEIEKEEPATRVRVEVDDHGPRMSSDMSDGDERYGAATYFADPLFRKSRTRPHFMRHFAKPPTYVDDRDRGRLIPRVRHMLNPFSRDRRRSLRDDGFSDDDRTPLGPPPPAPPAATHGHAAHVPHVAHRYPATSSKKPHPPRREESLSTTESESDTDGPPSRHGKPVIRQRRSHDAPVSPREYFPREYEAHRYSQDITPEHIPRKEDGPPPPLYGPTKSPLFATHVAQVQAANYYDRNVRPTMPVRTSYRPVDPRDSREPRVRYAAGVRPGDPDPPYSRDYDSNSSRHRDRRKSEGSHWDRDGDRAKGRDRDGRESTRTRSHDRDRPRDEWDERYPPRDREGVGREDLRDRERVRGGSRYVSGAVGRGDRGGVQDGVGGRRYPVYE